MLSHLRFHRRGPSNPTSPTPDTSSCQDSPSLQLPQLVLEESSIPVPEIKPRSDSAIPPALAHGQPADPPQQPLYSPPPPPPTQKGPPSLPPIARVAEFDGNENPDAKQPDEPRASARSPYTEQTGFLGGLALKNYRREQEAASTSPNSSDQSASYTLDSRSSYRPSKSPAVTSPPPRPPARTNTSFVSPTDLHHASTTGKRQAGTRMPSETASAPPHTAPPEPTKGKKGLPFLKNPMSSLLMRRKTNQQVPDLQLPLRSSYEPIRGTKIHDFSAPRPKRLVSSTNVSPMVLEKPPQETQSPSKEDKLPAAAAAVAAPPPPLQDEKESSLRTSSSTHSRSVSVDDGSIKAKASSDGLSATNSRRVTLMDNPIRRQDSIASSISTMDPRTRRQDSVPSSISTLSRNTSALSSKDVLSALPKHMKSTSSRFSFDMVGAARAEKLLEEKHRQRQQETEPESPSHRDSRFDDFDDDPFAYDDMDFDDGLEEKIPGVNADYDEEDDFYEHFESGLQDAEEEQDPDNDQENFAGFVFQRSNPASGVASPLDAVPLVTPRDAEGNVIGYATTQDAQPSPLSIMQANTPLSPVSPVKDSPTGLGIQGLNAAIDATIDATVRGAASVPADAPGQTPTTLLQESARPPPLNQDDELYFGGLGHEFEGEGDGSAFDESIFDLDDTDQYGRPIPGMFASALAQRTEAEGPAKRESDDVTSRVSAASGVTQSTAHTSLSVGPNQPRSVPEESGEKGEGKASPKEAAETFAEAGPSEEDTMAVYQAALAAAAHKAAASGKFRRDSDPPPPADVTITSPTTSGGSDHSNPIIDSFDDYEMDDGFAFDDGYDDGFSNGLDDYELDDDAIIAEANASALANDYDGWYGQEFGFFATPTQSQSQRSSLNDPSLSYGGFFGGNGVTRSKSGHLVSREPNLTPITERSEYSNRNSLMSLMSPSGLGRDMSSLQSPGLAQLAMMADDDNMSLSALMKLRSRAWGGSQASLVSSREGSPSDRNDGSSPWSPDGRDQGGAGGRKNSGFSFFSQDSRAGSASGSPTLTMSMPAISNQALVPGPGGSTQGESGVLPLPQSAFATTTPPQTFPPVMEDDEADTETVKTASPAAPTRRHHIIDAMMPQVGVPSQKRPGMGHGHKSSAGSISYSKEDDGTETHWVLERRRTADSGEIELEREVVENGRI